MELTYIEITDPEEILQAGDEYYCNNGEWCKVDYYVGTKRSVMYNRVRRPVPPTLGAPSPATLNPTDPKGHAGSKKTPLHLLPTVLMDEAAWVLKFGAERYGAYNWRGAKVCATTYISAILRHLNQWRDRQDDDPESGRSHLAHIAANCAILMDAAKHGTLEDDRA